MTTKKKKHVAIKEAKRGFAVKVALLGFGTVGSSVARVLAASKFPGVELTHIFNRNVGRKRNSEPAKVVPASPVSTEDIDVILRPAGEFVVEMLGGRNPGAGRIATPFPPCKSLTPPMHTHHTP